MRLGVLGGSFNPIHLGHLLIADDVRRKLDLDRVLFVPAFQPPHKPGPLAPYEHRVAMARLALNGQTGLELCLVEERLPVPSYTADTLRAVRSQHRDASLFFILGSDQYRDIRLWRHPLELVRLARFAVMSRPGVSRPPLYPGHSARRVLFLDVIQVSVSAAAIRKRLANGGSVRYMLPTRVLDYVKQHRLYSPAGPPKREPERLAPEPRSKHPGPSPKERK
jgi:nicotinate-nucleotide adenylyltransferase